MAWTDPTTRSTGEVITAAIWNTDLVDNLKETAPFLVTTKGDIVAATGNSALARLAVGSNGLALIADSTTATGLKYGAAGDPLAAQSFG